MISLALYWTYITFIIKRAGLVQRNLPIPAVIKRVITLTKIVKKHRSY